MTTRKGKAQNAQNQANQDTTVAAEMEAEAQRLTQDAANAEAAVTAAENQYQRLKAEYDQEQREEHQKKNQQPAKKQPGTGNSGTAGGAGGGGGCAPLPQLNPRHSLCRQAAAALAGAATAVAKAAAVILSAVLGPVLNTIAGCVTHPTVPGCLAAAGTIILIGSGFADAGADLAAEDASIPDSAIIAWGGQGDLPPPGEVFSGAQGQTAEEAGQGVVHGSFRWTTAGDIRAGAGRSSLLRS